MTKENYTNMSNKELLEEVRKVDSPLNHLGRKVHATNPNLFDEIVSRTSFLEDPNIQFTARLHCLEHDLVEQPKCKMCNNPVEWYGKCDSFRTYCSYKCKNEDKEFWNKVQDTCEERLGARNAFQSEVVKQKIREKNRKNLGVDYPMQSEAVRMKSRESCIANLGVDNPSKSEEVKTDKVCVACPPFGEHTERWKGTPSNMYYEFHDWAKMIREHVIAPNYIFIGPEISDDSKRYSSGVKPCGLFKRKYGIQWYPEYSN